LAAAGAEIHRESMEDLDGFKSCAGQSGGIHAPQTSTRVVNPRM
jgi:hypothetical protein